MIPPSVTDSRQDSSFFFPRCNTTARTQTRHQNSRSVERVRWPAPRAHRVPQLPPPQAEGCAREARPRRQLQPPRRAKCGSFHQPWQRLRISSGLRNGPIRTTEIALRSRSGRRFSGPGSMAGVRSRHATGHRAIGDTRPDRPAADVLREFVAETLDELVRGRMPEKPLRQFHSAHDRCRRLHTEGGRRGAARAEARHSRSVPLLLVHDVAQRLGANETAHVVEERVQVAGGDARRVAGDVRGEDEPARHLPQRVARR